VRYQVPQYLEVEDKIFGPFTLKQFLFAAGGLGGAYALWASLPSPLNFIGGGLAAVLCAALGFGQMNGRPFLVMVESMVSYVFSRKLFLWRKVPRPVEQVATESAETSSIVVPRLSDSKLKELAWGLDIQETLSYAKTEDEPPEPGKGRRIPTLPSGIL